MVMTIPKGCTHVQLARDIDYDQRPDFLKWDFDFYSWGSCTSYYCWHNWYQGAWHKDLGYQKPKDNPARLITVYEYKVLLNEQFGPISGKNSLLSVDL
jgi:hypothetical protein